MTPNFIKHGGFFLLRTPTFSLSALKKFHQETKHNDTELEIQILAFFELPFSNEALYLASPSLYDQYLKLRNHIPISITDKKKLIHSLYRYYLRCHSRSTPFGLFAGFCMGQIKEEAESSIELSNYTKHQKLSRIDSDWLFLLSNHLNSIPSFKKKLLYYSNPTLYLLNEKFRYAEYILSNLQKKYVLTSIQTSEYLCDILTACKNGQKLKVLIHLLVSKYEVSEDEANDFLNELINNQIILSEITPNVTGENYFNRLLKILKEEKDSSITQLYAQLIRIKTKLKLQETSLIDLNTEIKNMKIIEETDNYIQTDLKLTPTSCILNNIDVENILEQVKEISFFTHKKITKTLDQFKSDFEKRYGSDEVQLCMALDPETGIGFGSTTSISPLIDDIIINTESVTTDSTNIVWDDIQSYLLDQYINTRKKGLSTLKINEVDIVKFQHISEKINISESSYLFGSILKDNSGIKFIFNSLDGPSSSKLIGRFCIHDANLTLSTQTLLLEEQASNPSAIFAEIIYIPQARAGNVLVRPILRPYEIPIMGMSAVPSEKQIAIEDLMVSVRNNQIFIRSKRLNKRIIPRESSAFHPSINDLPIYIFLSYLPVQENPQSIMFRWGPAFNNKAFLPRIEYKNIIISLAQWTLTYNEVINLFSEKDLTSQDKLKRLRQAYKLPCALTLKSGNDVLLDLDHHHSLQILLKELKKNGSVVLVEDLDYHNEITFVKNCKEESYKNEIIIPLSYEKGLLKPKSVDILTEFNRTDDRTILPGTEYLYLKIYIGLNSGEDFLIQKFLPVFWMMKSKSIIEECFFIRYNDPENHLRIRFINRKDPNRLNEVIKIMSSVVDELMVNKIISNYYIAPYIQEVSSYGHSFIHNAESIFSVDSLFSLNLLSYLKNNDETDDKLKLSALIIGINDVFDVFNCNYEERLWFTENLSNGYFSEFQGNKDLKVQLDQKFRIYKRLLFDLLEKNSNLTVGDTLALLLHDRKIAIKKILDGIVSNDNYNLDVRNNLLERFIHLFINRICTYDPRKTELLIYALLNKLYKGIKGKNK